LEEECKLNALKKLQNKKLNIDQFVNNQAQTLSFLRSLSSPTNQDKKLLMKFSLMDDLVR
jgi:hypothetical protein